MDILRISASDAFDFVRSHARPSRPVTVTATGTSMLPFIHPGDAVALAPLPEYSRGDVVMARADGRVVLHAFLKTEGTGCVLMGTANLHLTERCALSDIAGAAVGLRRGGRRIAVGSRAWRAAMAAWLALRPARRILIFLYRKIWRQ